MKKALTALLSLFCCAVFTHAEKIHFDNITTDAGLSSKMVLSIAQDRSGFIWIISISERSSGIRSSSCAT